MAGALHRSLNRHLAGHNVAPAQRGLRARRISLGRFGDGPVDLVAVGAFDRRAVRGDGVGLSALCVLALAGPATAARPLNVRSQSGTAVTCTFATPGTGQTLTVPAGVSSLSLTLYGATGRGTTFGDNDPGGDGAEVTATLSDPGSVLGGRCRRRRRWWFGNPRSARWCRRGQRRGRRRRQRAPSASVMSSAQLLSSGAT